MKRTLFVFSSLFLGACASPKPAVAPPAADPAVKVEKIPSSLLEAVNAAYRPADHRARDVFRHPIETLNFFGLKPEHTVVEIEPGQGWYTEILAPFLGPNGHYVAAVNPKYAGAGEWLRAHPEFGTRADVVEFKRDGTAVGGDGTADLVLTFRNCHNWITEGTAARAFQTFYRALKPGGVLGVVDHRAKARGTLDPKSGYVREADVIALARAAGFTLSAKSELNANPKDTTIHPRGVWTLPPSLALSEVDKAKYLAIGESDRMTLRFTKPR